MKTAILILFLLFAGCGPSAEDKRNMAIASGETTTTGVKTIIIDSCEYLFYAVPYTSNLIHKANCKYHRKMQKDAVRASLIEYFEKP